MKMANLKFILLLVIKEIDYLKIIKSKYSVYLPEL